jgi:hypothetical protein
MSGLLEQVIIIVFSLHLGEPLVLDIAIISYIHHSSSQLSVHLLSSYQVGDLVILNTVTGCFGFSFFLGIFMFFLMFFFSSWVHGVNYRFHDLKIPLLPFIIKSWMWMDNRGYFKAFLRRIFLLRLN